MYYTYIIYSRTRDRYYIGHTGTTPDVRVERHNLGWTRSTKSGIPWELKYIKSFDTKSEAASRESNLEYRNTHNTAALELFISFDTLYRILS